MIGGYIRKFVSVESIQVRRWHSLGVCVISAVLWGIMVAIQVYQFPFLGRFFKAFAYNNVFVLSAAVGFFLFMLSFDIKNRVINWLSSSCLAAYLLQGSVVSYSWHIGVLEKYPPLQNPCQILSASALFLIIALLFDKLRILMVKPLKILSGRYIPKFEMKINRLYEKFSR